MVYQAKKIIIILTHSPMRGFGFYVLSLIQVVVDEKAERLFESTGSTPVGGVAIEVR